MTQRLIGRDEIWKLFVGHYWDSFEKDRDLILCHIDAVLQMTPPVVLGEQASDEKTGA